MFNIFKNLNLNNAIIFPQNLSILSLLNAIQQQILPFYGLQFWGK